MAPAMSSDAIPSILKSREVGRLLEHHRVHHGLATIVAPSDDGVPLIRGRERVASLQATGPRDAIEGLSIALGVLLDIEVEARRRHADLGRRLGNLSHRLEQMRGEYSEYSDNVKKKTEELLSHNRRLITAATTDPLTGLLNRRAIEGRMKELEAIADETPLPVAVIMADIDRFKDVNDTYGHLVGDAALAQLAELFSGRCRQSDTVGRWGGEEFVVLLSGCHLAPAARIAEDLRALLAEYPFHVAGGSFSITASFGVAAGTIGGQDGAETSVLSLLSEADRCLYQAKDAGRNQVIATPLAVQQAS